MNFEDKRADIKSLTPEQRNEIGDLLNIAPEMRDLRDFERAFNDAIIPLQTVLELNPITDKDQNELSAAKEVIEKLERLLNIEHAPPSLEIAALDLKAEGDFIHETWQVSNSYRTRYKPMKGADGQPITDIEAYIEQRGIPADYRSYYRKNTGGSFEEDIKRIPNQWLATNNSLENSEGAKSYLENLQRMTAQVPNDVVEAREALLKSLEAIHSEWHQRNASWTVPFGVPDTFQGSGIEARYNGALQYHKIAERHGILVQEVWREAFMQLMSSLVEEKFQPFSEMALSDAYLAIAHKTGMRPAIVGDEHVGKFFKEKLPPYSSSPLPADRQEEPAAILRFLSEHFSEIKGVPAENFELKSPPVPPGSSARIYLVRDKTVARGEVLAVMKIQSSLPGLDEISSTLAAEKEILTSDDFKPVKNLAAGSIGSDDYFVLQEAAQTFEAEKAVALSASERLQMVQKVASALASMHGSASELNAEELKADLITFRGNCFYDIRQMERYLFGDRAVLRHGVEEGSLAAASATKLTERITKLNEEYSRIVELAPELLCPAVIHGDFHGGNLFIKKENDQSQLIDYGGSTWFIGKKIGTGDRGNDIGRMIGNITVESTRHRLDFQDDVLPLISGLLDTYRQKVNIQEGSPQALALETSILFYANRFVAVNANDSQGKKFQPLPEDTAAALRSRLFNNWEKFLDSVR